MERQKETVLNQQLVDQFYHVDFTKQTKQGKVRNVYSFVGNIFETTDRLSVFDRVVMNNVPFKGAMLNAMNIYNKLLLEFHGISTDHIPASKDFFRSAGFEEEDLGKLSYCLSLNMLPIEFIVRGYLVGSAYKAYSKGESYCGFTFPEGLKEGDKLPQAILTPTTKESSGHDRPVTKEQCVNIIKEFLLNNDAFALMTKRGANLTLIAKKYLDEAYASSLKAFSIISEICDQIGDLMFIDTKFEFGIDKHLKLVLADEVGTPDSSRFAPATFYLETGKIVSLDKQIARNWYSEQGFTGEEDQPIPEMPVDIIKTISNTYINLAKLYCGNNFVEEFM